MSQEEENHKEERLEDFVPFPRSVLRDFRDGKISPNEFILYCYGRFSVDLYGRWFTSLKSIKEDIFRGIAENYINKLLLSLKSKRHIYYEDRKGRRGSFYVEFGELVLPDKTIKRLDKFFNPNEIRSENKGRGGTKSKVSQNKEPFSHKSEGAKESQLQGSFAPDLTNGIITCYNDNDKDKDNYILDASRESKSLNSQSLLSITGARDLDHCDMAPKTPKEEREWLKWLAGQLGEKNMKFLHGSYKKHGIEPILFAWERFSENSMVQTGKVENRGAYFNKIFQEIIREQKEGDNYVHPSGKADWYGRYKKGEWTGQCGFEEESDHNDEPSEKPPEPDPVYQFMLWGEEQRGGQFTNRKKQLAAIKKMKDAGILPGEIKDRWYEMDHDQFWEKNGFDFMDIANSFDKKR